MGGVMMMCIAAAVLPMCSATTMPGDSLPAATEGNAVGGKDSGMTMEVVAS